MMLLALILAANTGPLSIYLTEPCRYLDTREQPASFQSGPFVNEEIRLYSVEGSCDVPPGAKGLVLNVTVTEATVSGHLGLWRPGFSVLPPTSSLNFGPGQTIANGVITRINPIAGLADLMILAHVPGGQVHVIVDVVGFLK
jgi:hypothetical protein